VGETREAYDGDKKGGRFGLFEKKKTVKPGNWGGGHNHPNKGVIQCGNCCKGEKDESP